MDHPLVGELASFMRGGLERAEVKAVVRHLLTRCPRCVEVTRRLWGLGEQPPDLKAFLEEMNRRLRLHHPNRHRTVGGMPFMSMTAAARAQLLEIERALEAIRFRLLGLQSTLPLTQMETFPLMEVETLDVSTHIRAVIKCVLEDSIGPAIRDLREAAALPEELQ